MRFEFTLGDKAIMREQTHQPHFGEAPAKVFKVVASALLVVPLSVVVRGSKPHERCISVDLRLSESDVLVARAS